MIAQSVRGVATRMAAVVPWSIEQETAPIRPGARVRVTSPEWKQIPFGTVTDVWEQDRPGDGDPKRVARVEMDGLEEAVSFPVEDLIRRL